ncbi:uncharacterized protein LOC106165239 isoform X1 [Lingula anatina]|uniref:molybdopterin molybdotransferase n=1 Tax=Lingula anatina TaxID=7574 RepID=A0A1S3ILQ0_LINAN|nr:uncharacterized protein LOC106165239 isoform X1 [Lingula anatina]|eukprot:XP_013398821.1 uncharacterized protein LOC106165239 isoform X1 [Lingula anatina]
MATSSEMEHGTKIKIGILTASDSCFEGKAEDKSSANLKILIEDKKIIPGKVVVQSCVPDDIEQIKEKLTIWSDALKLDLILTTGGTGFAPRDVTPEATKSILHKEAPGMTIAMIKASLDVTPLAMLSRLVCGTRGSTLIINLPGSKKGSQECLEFVTPAIPHAVDLLQGNKENVVTTHTHLQAETTPEPPVKNRKATLRSSRNQQTQLQEKQLPKTTDEQVASASVIPQRLTRQQQTIVYLTNMTSDGEITVVPQYPSGKNPKSKEGAQSGSDSNPVVALHDKDQQKSHLDQNSDLNVSSEISPPSRKSTRLSLKKKVKQRASFQETADNDETSSAQTDVYDFEEDGENSKSGSPKAGGSGNADILKAKRNKKLLEGAEIIEVPVGVELKNFLSTHEVLKDTHLVRGKRHVKRSLLHLQRQENAVDTGSWKRGSRVHERNRLDDYFTPTAEGLLKIEAIQKKAIRDEYAVNWYLWCSGVGNCKRQCGGYGKCVDGCSGPRHKQDRHNCSLLLNLKIYLSNLSMWVIRISGRHVDDKVEWIPPPTSGGHYDEDIRDVLMTFSDQVSSPSQVHKILVQKKGHADIPSKHKVECFVTSLRRRRRAKDYDYASKIRKTEDVNSSIHNYSCNTQATGSGISGHESGGVPTATQTLLQLENNQPGCTETVQYQDTSNLVPVAVVGQYGNAVMCSASNTQVAREVVIGGQSDIHTSEPSVVYGTTEGSVIQEFIHNGQTIRVIRNTLEPVAQSEVIVQTQQDPQSGTMGLYGSQSPGLSNVGALLSAAYQTQ